MTLTKAEWHVLCVLVRELAAETTGLVQVMMLLDLIESIRLRE